MWIYLFTTDSLFVHTGKPLTTIKQRHINNRGKANKMRVFIKYNACFLGDEYVCLQELKIQMVLLKE